MSSSAIAGQGAAPVNPPPMPEAIGSFRITGKLGQGGMGTVYKAIHGTLERPVALKILPPEFAANPEYVMRFLREARTIATLRHDNIVQVYDAGEQGGQYFIAMELVDGSNLLKYSEEKSEVAEKDGLALLMQAAKGLAAAHAKGLVHRDIKPENLLLGNDGILRIVDFGLVMESTSTTQLTATGACLGTPMYMSPEQADGENADARTDLYSLGVTFYRVFTGRTPFTSPTVMNLLFKHKFEAPPEPKSVQPKLSQNTSNLILHLMSKRREDRPQTAEKLIEMIELINKGKSIPAPVKFLPTPVGESSVIVMAPGDRIRPAVDHDAKRKLALIAVAAVLIVAVITAIVAKNWGSNTNTTTNNTVVNKSSPIPDPVKAKPITEVPRNPDTSQDERAKRAIAFKQGMAAGKTAEDNGQLEEAERQYAIAAQNEENGTNAQQKLETIRGKIANARKPDPVEPKITPVEQQIALANQAEKSKTYDKAAEYWSQAAKLSDPPDKATYADKANECRRLDCIARAKAAEILKDYASAEQYYRSALNFKDDTEVQVRLEAVRLKLGVQPASQTASSTTTSTAGNFDSAMGDARTALDRGDFKTARQKANLAQQLQPTRPEAVAVLKEIDGREEMQKGDDAKSRGDADAAIVFYSNAKDKCPELKQAAMAKIEALRNKIVPSVAKDDQIDALVRAYKYTDALNSVTTRLNADPSNVQLKSMKDAIESLRTTLTFCSEMKTVTESAKETFVDARDYDDDEKVNERKKEFDKLRNHFNDYPGQQQNNFLARDFDAVKASARSARDDASDTESKLSSAASFFERRSEKADEGINLPVIGSSGNKKKAKAYSHFAETMRKLAEKTRELMK